MTIGSNPRILVLAVVVAGMAAIAVLGFVLIGVAVGFIFLAVAAYLAFQLLKFARSHLRSRINAGEETIAFALPTNEYEEFLWTDITLAGYCTPTRGKPFAFVYCEKKDRLLTIPNEYTDFDALVVELEKSAPAFERFHLGPGVTIQEKLRERLNIVPTSDEEPEADEE